MTSSSAFAPTDRPYPADEPCGRRLHAAAPAGRRDRDVAASAVDPARGGHPDARTVGTLLARYAYVARDLSGLESKAPTAIVAAARALARDAAAGEWPSRRRVPFQHAEGGQVRGLAGFAAAQAAARTASSWCGLRLKERRPRNGSPRSTRHTRRTARRSPEGSGTLSRRPGSSGAWVRRAGHAELEHDGLGSITISNEPVLLVVRPLRPRARRREGTAFGEILEVWLSQPVSLWLRRSSPPARRGADGQEMCSHSSRAFGHNAAGPVGRQQQRWRAHRLTTACVGAYPG